MIKFTQSDVVDLVVEKIKQFGRSKSGTYNRADPTTCVSGRASFLFGEESPVEIKFYDGTWGAYFALMFLLDSGYGREEIAAIAERLKKRS